MSISRRNLFVATGVGAAAIAAGGTALTLENLATAASAQTMTESKVLRSKNGLLDITLTASYINKTVGGQKVRMLAYNGSVPGPTLWVKPGDKLRIKFVNNLGFTTNLHTHGLHVSPERNGDNPFVMIENGQTFQYEYRLPIDHPAGTFWYHPHHHGQAANQTFGGLYGAIIVDEGINMGNVTERVMVISDVSITTDGQVSGANMMSKMMGREGDLVMVNGTVQPTASINRGEERWHIINACVSRNLNLTVAGAPAKVIHVDGHPLVTPTPAKNILMSPGNRVDLLVQPAGGDVTLNYTTVPHPDSMGMGGMGYSTRTYKNYPLATFKDTGKKVAGGMAMWSPANEEDLRKASSVTKRSFALNMPSMSNMGGMMGGGMGNMAGQFTINGQSFDPNRIDTNVKFGAVEEWTISNKSTMAHPFHLHVWPMQILAIGSTKITEVRYQDVVNIPAKGQVTVRVRFSDYKGMAVYHCHILDHEDLGMMGIIQAS